VNEPLQTALADVVSFLQVKNIQSPGLGLLPAFGDGIGKRRGARSGISRAGFARERKCRFVILPKWLGQFLLRHHFHAAGRSYIIGGRFRFLPQINDEAANHEATCVLSNSAKQRRRNCNVYVHFFLGVAGPR
jgi:hypothetical protein